MCELPLLYLATLLDAATIFQDAAKFAITGSPDRQITGSPDLPSFPGRQEAEEFLEPLADLVQLGGVGGGSGEG
jgi:hypothetical protein